MYIYTDIYILTYSFLVYGHASCDTWPVCNCHPQAFCDVWQSGLRPVFFFLSSLAQRSLRNFNPICLLFSANSVQYVSGTLQLSLHGSVTYLPPTCVFYLEILFIDDCRLLLCFLFQLQHCCIHGLMFLFFIYLFYLLFFYFNFYCCFY